MFFKALLSKNVANRSLAFFEDDALSLNAMFRVRGGDDGQPDSEFNTEPEPILIPPE